MLVPKLIPTFRCVQEVLVVPLLKMRRECSAVGCQVELQVSMTTMQQMNYKWDPDAFYQSLTWQNEHSKGSD